MVLYNLVIATVVGSASVVSSAWVCTAVVDAGGCIVDTVSSERIL